MIIATFIIPNKPTSLRGKVYPDYALAIGWILVAIPIIAIPIGAIYQINKYKDNPVSPVIFQTFKYSLDYCLCFKESTV